MNTGKLNKRVTIQQPSNGKGASGGKTTTWADWKTVWANVRPLSGSERRATSHGGEGAEARTEFAMRYRPGIDEEMRVAYGGKVYNIRHIKDVNEDHDMLILTCDTGSNDG